LFSAAMYSYREYLPDLRIKQQYAASNAIADKKNRPDPVKLNLVDGSLSTCCSLTCSIALPLTCDGAFCNGSGEAFETAATRSRHDTRGRDVTFDNLQLCLCWKHAFWMGGLQCGTARPRAATSMPPLMRLWAVRFCRKCGTGTRK
jgi:hypothetical protein